MSDLKSYYEDLINQINEHKMNSFWILCNIKEFKPITDASKDKLKKYIKTRENLWGQMLANIDLLHNIDSDSIDKSKSNIEVFTIKIYMYKINDNGEFDNNSSNTWRLVINYNKDELENKRPTYEKLIENIKIMLKLVEKKQIVSDIFGLSYTEFINAFNKLKQTKAVKRSKTKHSKPKYSKPKHSKTKHSKTKGKIKNHNY